MKAPIYLLLMLLLPFFGTAASAENSSILIIKSSDNSFFNKTIERLINQTQAPVKFNIKTIATVENNESLLFKSSLIITMGLKAANYTNSKSPTIPVIHSYITEFQYIKHKKQLNHYSILLDQPLQRYLSFIKHLLPVDKIGLIKHKANQINTKRLEKLSSSLDLSVQQEIFRTGDNPINTVRDLLQKSEVLLSLPDPEIYNRKTLKGILLTSYRQNKPLISYSPAHVKSGALAAIFSSPENIGNQIAQLLDNLLLNKKFKASKFYYATEFDIKINDRVAKSLGLSLTSTRKILSLLEQEQVN